MVRMADVMTWWQYTAAVWLNFNIYALVPFNQTNIQVHWKSKRKLTRLKPVHHTCQLTVWNFIRQDCCLVEYHSRELLCCCSCNIYACWPSVFTATNTATIQICLLVEWCCKMDASCVFVTQSYMLAGVVTSICHTCRYGVSLSAVPAGLLPPYRQCLLVWFLTISHACWYVASL